MYTELELNTLRRSEGTRLSTDANTKRFLMWKENQLELSVRTKLLYFRVTLQYVHESWENVTVVILYGILLRIAECHSSFEDNQVS